MPNWVKRLFFQILPPFVFMSKPHIANAILHPEEDEENDHEEKEILVNKENNIKRLNNYIKTISINKYPPVIQRAIKDIRYISETQREAQKDDLVRIEILEKRLSNKIFFFLGKRRLEIYRTCYRSMFFDYIHIFNDHWFIYYIIIRSVHT